MPTCGWQSCACLSRTCYALHTWCLVSQSLYYSLLNTPHIALQIFYSNKCTKYIYIYIYKSIYIYIYIYIYILLFFNFFLWKKKTYLLTLWANSDQTYFKVIVIGQTSNERLNAPTCMCHRWDHSIIWTIYHLCICVWCCLFNVPLWMNCRYYST